MISNRSHLCAIISNRSHPSAIISNRSHPAHHNFESVSPLGHIFESVSPRFSLAFLFAKQKKISGDARFRRSLRRVRRVHNTLDVSWVKRLVGRGFVQRRKNRRAHFLSSPKHTLRSKRAICARFEIMTLWVRPIRDYDTLGETDSSLWHLWWDRFKIMAKRWDRFEIVAEGWDRFEIMAKGWDRFEIMAHRWERFDIMKI
jgi:hypothetical protein